MINYDYNIRELSNGGEEEGGLPFSEYTELRKNSIITD